MTAVHTGTGTCVGGVCVCVGDVWEEHVLAQVHKVDENLKVFRH